MVKQRLDRLRQLFPDRQIEALLVTRPENRRYLSGFTGTAGILLITDKDAYLLTDFRYVEQALRQAPEFEVVQHGTDLVERLGRLLAGENIKQVGFEEDFVTYKQYYDFSEGLKPAELMPARGIVEELRLTKDKEELELLQQAVDIADQAFSHILGFIKPGIREIDVALELEYFMRKAGAKGPSFEIIVASGPRSSLPHGVASDRVIQQGDLIVLDFGAVYQGYHSDMTRTVVMGQPSDKQREIYRLVLAAHEAASRAIKPGAKCSQIDEVARSMIACKGYGDNFGHALGHGVGLAVHEGPRLAAVENRSLEPGMTVTVEPGVYLKDWGGVRIEDIVVVSEQGRDVLTRSSKELIVLPS